MHLNSWPLQQQGQGDLQVIYKNKEPGRRPGLLLDLQYSPSPNPATPATDSAPPNWHSLALPWKRAALQITSDSYDDIHLRKPPFPLTGSALCCRMHGGVLSLRTHLWREEAREAGERRKKGGEGLFLSELKEFFQQYIDLECLPLISSNVSQTAAANPAELRGTLIGNRFPKFR